MTKHTPGPWEYTFSPGDYSEGTIIAGAYTIAVVMGQNWGQWRPEPDSGDAEFETNARLIAAAPDLLDACNVALGHMTGGLDGDYRDCDPRDILRAAIAKAESTP